MKRFRALVLLIAAACLTLAALNLAHMSAGLVLASSDDETLAVATRDAARADDYVMLDLSLGRFYAGLKFWSLSQLQHLASLNPVAFIALRTLCLLLPALAIWWFLEEGTGRAEFGASVSLFWLATYYFFTGYQPLLSNPLLLVGLTAVLFSCIAILKAQTSLQPTLWRGFALLSFTAALVTHENFVVFVLVLAWAGCFFASPGWNLKTLARTLAPYLSVIVVYAGIYVLLKDRAAALGNSYDGTSLQFRLLAFLHALATYTATAIPGFELIFSRTGVGRLGAFLSGPEVLQRVSVHLHAADVALGLLAGSTVVLLFRQLASVSPRRFSPAFFGSTAALILLPNILIASTHKYQVWAHQRRFPYYYAGLGIPFFWLLVVVTLWTVLRLLQTRHPGIARFLTIAVGIFAALGIIALAAISREAVAAMSALPFR